MHPIASAPVQPRPATPRPRPWRARRLAAGLLGLTLLGGCGGGVSIGIGIGIDLTPPDDPPQVSLAVNPSAAFQGDPIDLTASASDDHRVSAVELWQSNNGSVVQLGVARGPVLGLTVGMPFAPTGTVFYMARAVDDIGQVSSTPWRPVTLR